MDSGLGMSVSRSHESSDAEKSTKKSTSALSEASSGSQENKADGPVAPLINSSDASHDQTTTPQSSPNRSRGESRSPRYRNDDSDTSYQDEDWNEDGFDQEPGTVARLFSADRADAVKACLCPATSHSSDSFAADSAASETNGAFLGPIALNLNDLAWAWEAPTAGLNVEGTSAELGTETGYSSTAAASTPASASESSLGAGLSVSSTRDPLWPPPLQPLPPLVVPWALPPLGQGSFGVVYACLWRGKLSAVKYQRMPPGDFDLTNLAVELALLKSLSHEHLVKFKGVFAVDPRIMEGGKSSKKSSKSSCSNSGIGSSDCSGSNSNNSSSSAVASNYGSNQEHLPPFLLPPPWRAINATTCGFVGIITELCAEGSLDDFFKAHRSPPSLLHSSKSVANEGGGKEEGGPLSTAAVPLPSCHEASSTQEQLHHPGFPASPQDGPPWAWRLQWCKEPASALAHLLPANVLLDSSFRVRLCDYGLAVGADSDARLQFVGGTEQFMAPEVLLATEGGYGPPADLFGYGLVLASLLALKPACEDGFLERSPRSFFEVNVDELRAAAQLPDPPSKPNPVPDGSVNFNQANVDNGDDDVALRAATLDEEVHAAAVATCAPSLSMPSEELLGLSGCPASFLELASQCLDPEPSGRPTAEEAEGWLDALAKDLQHCPEMRHGEPPRPLATSVASNAGGGADGGGGSFDSDARGERVAKSATILMDHLFGDEGDESQQGGDSNGSNSTASTTTNSSSSSSLAATVDTAHSRTCIAPARAFFLIQRFMRQWATHHRSATPGRNKESSSIVTGGSSSTNNISSDSSVSATNLASSEAAFFIAALHAAPSSVTRASSAPAAVRPLFDYSRDSPLVSRDQSPSLASAGMPSNHPHPVYLEIWLRVLAFALLITLIGF